MVSGKTYSWQNFNVSGAVIPNGTYKIINQNSGLALEAPNDWTGNGQQINQWSYYGGASQQWTVTQINGYYSIIGVQSGRSLDIYGGNSGNGTMVELWDYWNGPMQQWNFIPSPSAGYYAISPNCAPGSCVAVASGSTANGANVWLWTYTAGHTAQQWSLQAP